MESIKKTIRPLYWNIYSSFHRLKYESPVFIVGCGHSGTTLMLRILHGHDELFGIDYESSVIGQDYINYPLLVSWTKARRKSGKSAWIEKTPDQIRYLDKIFSTFPKARIIVMVRDGRDVALSLKNRGGNIESHMKRWVQDNNYWLKYEKDARVIPVKLEKLTENSKKVLKDVCQKIGVEYCDNLLEYHNKEFTYSNTEAKKTDGKGGNHQLNRNWQVNQKIFKSTNRWEKEAEDSDLDLFNNLEFKSMLSKLNYLV